MSKDNDRYAASIPKKKLMQEKVLAFPKLAERIAERPGDKESALKCLEEIACDFSWKVLENIKKTLNKTLLPLYDGIDFQLAPDMDLKKLVAENSVVFVPNHQSHADYLLLSYVLVSQYKLATYIAGGKNLDIFPIGPLFRKGGCFFIRRSFKSDMVYKLTLEAYIAYLLKDGGLPIEFFFEGGRSRTGKLLPPKFGLFQMLIDVQLRANTGKPLLFVPVSIVHEIVPEQNSFRQELKGKKKKKESFLQLLKLYKVFSRHFGTVHIRLNEPIALSSIQKHEGEDLKKLTQNMAFECYRSVGRGMMVTPSGILALILLDEPTGALTYDNITTKAETILSYCERFRVPLPQSLKSEKWRDSLERALDLFVEGKKIDKVANEGLNLIYYAINPSARLEVLYSKNNILHHFLVPFFIDTSWINIFNGSIKTPTDLRNHLLDQRKKLKYEFYLPTVRELMTLGLEIVSSCVNKEIKSIADCFTLEHKDLYAVARQVGVFSNSFRYINEGYYLSALTLKHLKQTQFNWEKFLKVSKEIFTMEMRHGRFIKYSESYSEFLMRNSLKYFLNQQLIREEKGEYQVQKTSDVEAMIEKYARELANLLVFSSTLNKI